MKRVPFLVVTFLVVVGLAAATVGLVMAQRDDTAPRSHRGMMAAGSSSSSGWSDDSWASARGPMMGPMMGQMMGPMMEVGMSPATEPEYLAEMVAHHQDAVTAARELARSGRPEMRALGEAIVLTQSAQIETMTSWLAHWYPDQPDTDYQPMMRDLSGLSGDQLDRAFLEDMIGHHMVAVMMSQRLLVRGADHEQVAALARSIRNDQHAEIIQMRRWLGQWFGGGPAMHAPRGMGSGMMSSSRR